MKIETTGCCALIQLRATNDTTKEEIKERMDEMLRDQNQAWYNTPNDGSGATSMFCIVTLPYEKPLKKTLKDLGFKKINTFKRRAGYPEGKNQIMILNI